MDIFFCCCRNLYREFCVGFSLLNKSPVSEKQTRRSSSALEGPMKKKNPRGLWKDRFARFSSDRFTTYKPRGKGPPSLSDIKEDFDIRLVQSVTMKSTSMVIELLNGNVYEYQSPDIDTWCKILKARLDQALIDAENLDLANKVHLSGKLLKKSHNKYQKKLQVCYFLFGILFLIFHFSLFFLFLGTICRDSWEQTILLQERRRQRIWCCKPQHI